MSGSEGKTADAAATCTCSGTAVTASAILGGSAVNDNHGSYLEL